MGKTVRAMTPDRVMAKDLELEPDDIIKILEFQNDCDHPDVRRCLNEKDEELYECVVCGFLSKTRIKQRPLSEDKWI